MGLSEKLVEIKSETEALITYANGVTGESDARLGDAILSLAEGFGQGGGGLTWYEFTPTEDIPKANITFEHMPDAGQCLFCYDSGGYVVSANYILLILYYTGRNVTMKEVGGVTTWNNGSAHGLDGSSKYMAGRTYKYAIIGEGMN